MNRLMLVVMLPLLVGPAFAGNDLSTISDPNAKLRPADPNAPFCVESPVPPSPVTDQAPPFGTVVRQWDLGMSGSYAGAGITWRRDSGRFYLIAQGRQMWSVDPANPPGTARQERWVFPNMGSGTLDIPWSLAWDNDSGCFWISNVVDGNIYGGCYYTRIRKSDVGDTWRWVPTNPGDTWLVGTGTAGGAGSMYWMAGSEKWLDRGIFACAPVAPSPGTNNYVWKFEPYSKQSRGRCPNGHMTSERGCGLVPWDSNYILTTGWNANTHYKRDSTGLALQSQPATVYGPADNAVWVPQIIGPDDTVFMYTICSNPTNTLQKISVGMRWNQLPSINPFNVRPLSILAPTGTIDSGQTIFPKLVIRNMSNEPADDVSAWFMIDDGTAFPYLDSAKNLYLDMRTTCTLQFSAWMPQGRDSMGVVAWTYWAGDSFPQDDTIRNRFLVRVKDIAVTQIIDPAPDTTLDSGVVFNPRARVWNYGNVSVNFDCRFTIGRYRSTRNLNLIAGGATIVTARDPYTAMPGIWSCIVNALVVGDLHPENNVRADTFTVRGEIYRDVEAIAVLSPPSVVDTTTLITPRGLITNNGVGAAAFKSFFIIQNAAGTPVYADSANHMLGPGDTAEVAYKDVWLNNIGIYYAAESVSMDDDQKSINDVKRIRVRVVSKLSGDIGVLRITSPAGNIKADSTFTPAAIWKNYSDEAAPYDAFFFFHNKYGARVYRSVIPGLTLSPNSETTLTFEPFNPGTDTGLWKARCSTMAGDTNFANDTLNKSFKVYAGDPPPRGWLEMSAVPMTPSGKAVKDGGWVAYDAGTGQVYAAKGNKAADFYAFDPMTDGGWVNKVPIPEGTEGKPPSKGAAGCADGNGKVYCVKGNNTLGFYAFDAMADSNWAQLGDVPLGTGKKIKGGAGLAYAYSGGVGAVYLLKGYKNEFYKFSEGAWAAKPVAPAGGNPKYDKGSWLVSDGASTLYAFKAKYHEFYAYDCEMDSWSGQKKAMPMSGSAGTKKAKDGSAGAWLDGKLYAFKGGNTTEFWCYDPMGDSWGEREQIPLIGSTGKKKKVKSGGALTAVPGQLALYGLKGNKCLEFWRYVPAIATPAPGREGVMAGAKTGVTGTLFISPNPLAGGFATVRYSLPKPGLAALRIYDVTGRTVLSQTLAAGRSGTTALDLRKLNPGVYLVKVTTDGFSSSQKLVVQR